MWQFKIQTQESQGGVASNPSSYPDRPGEPDCIYYLRTGLCGYGTNCRFNHPVYSGQAAQHRGELLERAGQPECQEEKACPYYMRTGNCKFGISCKFNHPHPAAALGPVLPVTGPTFYGFTGLSVTPSSGLPYAGGLPTWSLPRGPSISGQSMQGGPPAYMHVFFRIHKACCLHILDGVLICDIDRPGRIGPSLQGVGKESVEPLSLSNNPKMKSSLVLDGLHACGYLSVTMLRGKQLQSLTVQLHRYFISTGPDAYSCMK